jgi:NADPH-dependent 2,4-dienoyl-CoA reductase/sulfur reductase-like enzyme
VTVAIVGAGLGGLRTAEALRQQGYDGRITLIGSETHLPYSRPPLSKEVLRGDAEAAASQLRNNSELAALDLDLRLGVTAAALRVGAREVVLGDASTVGYDDVVIATGAAPRTLPGVALEGVHTLRTLDDSLRLRDAVVPGAQVVVIGAGFIGLEVAASARARGADVTIVDVLPAPLSRVLDVSIGSALQALHEANHVAFRMGVGVSTVDGAGRVERVTLADGSSLPCDVLVVGIGVAPATAWLADSGLRIDDGVECDASLRAAPGVWAIGDVARWAHPNGNGTVRIEHWTNATEQPLSVASSIVSGEPQPFTTVPYFWSDQYDAKLQSIGMVTKGEEMRIVSGSLDEPKWVAVVRDGDRLGGVIGLRSAGRVMKLRPLLASGASWHDALDAAAS